MSSPTARTLALLRTQGYVADVCERWIPRLEIKRDLLGAFDVIGVKASEPGVLAVQATSRDHTADRVKKLQRLQTVKVWLQAGNRAEVWGWGQDHDGRWRPRVVALRPEDLAAVELTPRRRRRGRRPEQRGLFDEQE